MPFSNSDPYHARGYPPRMHSPSSSSMGRASSPHSSSHRPHPYRRSPNPHSTTATPQPEQQHLRMTLPPLPPPNLLGGGAFKFSSTYDVPSPRERDYPPLTHDQSWRSPVTTAGRPASSGSVGDRSRTPSQRLAGEGRAPLHLPPLHSISGGTSRSGETSPNSAAPTMYLPPREAASSSSTRISPRSRPQPPPPSYGDYEPAYPPRPQHAHAHELHHRHDPGSIYRAEERYRDEMYERGNPPAFPQHPHASRTHMYDPPSPLRQVHHALPGMTQVQFPLPGYYGGPPPDAAMSMSMGRQRSHSSAPGFSRPTTGDEEGGRENAAGQSRRVAHLMSEQKRRESINSGFQALRTTVPTTSATDSKAIILKKAVAHINHLEGLLKRHNIEFTPGEACEDAEGKKDQ
ncbi:hypothetical protein I350_01078 [Cryptococcus amylolentus CBS 6273]|nr:hypothetical protein I350_01078 [Cryptococcus amylolentus CBS 6273]